VVEIVDSGGGIDEKIFDKIFEPYFSTKSEKNGTGLGLYMSKLIIEKHMFGLLSATNTKSGTCFKIEIPINTKEEK
jgi:signal transduction histidine kinase